MTFRQFQKLDEADQDEVFREQAVLVGDYSKNGRIYQLYQLTGFYIEVRYNITLNYIESCTAFAFCHRVDPYLQLIPLAWLKKY